jgi:hypothetical protein
MLEEAAARKYEYVLNYIFCDMRHSMLKNKMVHIKFTFPYCVLGCHINATHKLQHIFWQYVRLTEIKLTYFEMNFRKMFGNEISNNKTEQCMTCSY